MTGVVTIKTSGGAVGSTLKNYSSSGLILSQSLAWDKRKKRKKYSQANYDSNLPYVKLKTIGLSRQKSIL